MRNHSPEADRPAVSVIAPAYNEAESIGLFYEQVVVALDPVIPDFELILVDDGSTDSTFSIIEQLAQKDSRVTGVKFRRNFGQTRAMATGIDLARAPILVTLDSDLQNDPGDIPLLVGEISKGHDIAAGYRIRRQDRFLTRKLPSVVANWLIGRVTGLPIRDNGCSLKAYRAEAIKQVPLYSEMHRFIPSMSIPGGVSVVEVGVRHHARQFGTSKYGLARIYRVFFDLLVVRLIISFAARPLTCFGGAGATAVLILIVTITASMLGPEGSGQVFLTVSMLIGSAAVFLFMAGVTIALAQEGINAGKRLDDEVVCGQDERIHPVAEQ
ncbi:glycosyltransferase family 2 protein [Roseobacter ponti]|uniref:Glycosyltransferase family 2 protein n=1 Tax=Roseobacter ponti TaxID=1891787 RepID=A0A858STS1_9RHOB|nr:glycosyltransferase family 2 protein [Roseobacter ponti]QJF50276.1 glycosyltransferase family 2 protein [Roseobacter ponti]